MMITKHANNEYIKCSNPHSEATANHLADEYEKRFNFVCIVKKYAVGHIVFCRGA